MPWPSSAEPSAALLSGPRLGVAGAGDAKGDARRVQTWRAHPDTVQPVVLIIGGFLTSPPLYWHMRRRLLRRGVADVVIAPIWLPDWILAPARGLGPIVTRAGRSLLQAGHRSAASPRSLGAPVLVVGHSAGGVVARILTSPEPFEGRRLDASGRIGAIVSLGSPHRVSGQHGERRAGRASSFAERVVPGARFAPTTGYLTVMSRHVVGDPLGDGRQQTAHRLYRQVHDSDRPGTAPAGPIEGDGLIPLSSARLPGAREIVLDDAIHGQLAGEPWYGVDEMLERWWPDAMEVWREALLARVGAGEWRGPGTGA
jgi:hypothetical protein